MEFLFLAVPVTMFAWMIFEGIQNQKLYPGEEEMMRRLIRMRTDRKMAAISKDELEAEIEAASERLVNTSKPAHA